MIDFKDKICNIFDLYDKITKYLTSKVKVVFLGESNAGKTAFFSRYKDNIFEDNLMSTTVTSYAGKTEWFEEENQSINFELWDTAGQKNFVIL